MSGPWYEEQGPTTDEVRKKLISVYIMPKKAYKFVKLETIEKIIDEVIAIEEKEYGGWGSYRGYYTFTHHKLVKIVNKKVQAAMEINARNKINQFIEIGPGKVLSGLIKRIDKNVLTCSINNEEDIKKININD